MVHYQTIEPRALPRKTSAPPTAPARPAPREAAPRRGCEQRRDYLPQHSALARGFGAVVELVGVRAEDLGQHPLGQPVTRLDGIEVRHGASVSRARWVRRRWTGPAATSCPPRLRRAAPAGPRWKFPPLCTRA